MTDGIRIGFVSRYGSAFYIAPDEDVQNGIYAARIKDMNHGRIWEGTVTVKEFSRTRAIRFPAGAGGFEPGDQVAYRLRSLKDLGEWFDSDESTGVRA